MLRLSHEPERDFYPDMRITKVDQENSIGWQCIGGDDLGDNTFRFDWSTTSKPHGYVSGSTHYGTFTSTEAPTSKACG